jgi:hypothetical protein
LKDFINDEWLDRLITPLTYYNSLGSFIAIGLIEKYFKTIIQNTTSLKNGRGKPCPYKNLITHNS